MRRGCGCDDGVSASGEPAGRKRRNRLRSQAPSPKLASMRIAFVGDVHGCIYHCLAALLRLHARHPLDAILQAGDLGAWPDKATEVREDPASVWYAEDNPAQDHRYHLLDPGTALAGSLKRARELLGQPIFFIRGNHEDADWLRALDATAGLAAVDPLGLFTYVHDGTVLELAGLPIAMLGGIEVPEGLPPQLQRNFTPHRFDETALRALRTRNDGADILVTHDSPYAATRSWRGEPQGSKTLTDLSARLRPKWHVGGHYHTPVGPLYTEATCYLGLSCLIYPLKPKWSRSDERHDPRGPVQPTSIAVLDTGGGRVEAVAAEITNGIDCALDFDAFVASL